MDTLFTFKLWVNPLRISYNHAHKGSNGKRDQMPDSLCDKNTERGDRDIEKKDLKLSL